MYSKINKIYSAVLYINESKMRDIESVMCMCLFVNAYYAVCGGEYLLLHASCEYIHGIDVPCV